MASTPLDGVTTRHLTADDLTAAARVFRTSLGLPGTSGSDSDGGADVDADRYAHYWDVDDSLGAFDPDGRLLGVAATWEAEFTVPGGAAVSCAAVPSVGVRPDSHRRGVGRALLERQVREAADRGAAVMALNASEVGIYGRYGYGPTSPWWATVTDPRRLRWRDDAPQAVPGSITELDGRDTDGHRAALHQRVFGNWHGELSRPDNWWWAILNPSPGASPTTTALHRDEDGDVDGAIVFTVKMDFDDTGFANTVEVHDAVAVDARVEALLWRWLLERRLVGKVECERTNPRLPLTWMLEDPRCFVTQYESDAVWVRILDVPRVLEARTTAASGQVRLGIVDPALDTTTGTWAVTGGNGRLTAEPVDADPELTVSVDLLAPLVWGYARAATLVAAGRIPRPMAADAAARLDTLLATDGPGWCSTGF